MKQGLIDISFNRIDHGSKNGLYTSHNGLNEFLKEWYFVSKSVLTYSSNQITTKLGDRKLKFDWFDFINKQPKF